MTTFIPDGYSLYFLNALLDWFMVLTASYFGLRLVRAHEKRLRPRTSRRALQRRVHELEQVTEELGSQLQQVLEAERFASALQLSSSRKERAWHAEQTDQVASAAWEPDPARQVRPAEQS